MRTLILDTGPLLDYVCFRCLQSDGRGPHGLLKLIKVVKKARQAQALERFVRGFHVRLTVPGVSVELWQHLRDAVDGNTRAEAVSRLVDSWRDWGIAETCLPFIDLPKGQVLRDGPVDVSLRELAKSRRGRHSEVVLLTTETDHLPMWRQESLANVMTIWEVPGMSS